MSRYATVETFIWHDEKLRELPEDARHLFLYLLTSPHGNMCGLFYLPELYACSDLQWEPKRYRKGIDTLCHTLLIEVDGDVIWLKNYLKYNPIRGPRQVTGAAKKLMDVPGNNLIGSFMQHLEKHLLEDDVELFKELYTKPYDIPYRYPIDTLSHTLCDTPSIAVTVTDTVTDTVTATATDAREAPEKQDDDAAESNRNDALIKHFAQAFGAPPNQAQVEMLLSFSKEGIPDELIIEALKRSAEAGASSPKYTVAILQSWVSKKALTLDDVKALDNLRRPHRRDGPTTSDDFTYSAITQDRSKFSFLTDEKEGSA